METVDADSEDDLETSKSESNVRITISVLTLEPSVRTAIRGCHRTRI